MQISKKMIVACVIWGLVVLPLMGMLVSEINIVNFWFQFFALLVLMIPVWLNFLWTFCYADFKKQNKFVLPLLASITICVTILFSADYRFKDIAWLPFLILLATFCFGHFFSNPSPKEFLLGIKKLLMKSVVKRLIIFSCLITVFYAIYEDRKRERNQKIISQMYQEIDTVGSTEKAKEYEIPVYDSETLRNAMVYDDVKKFLENDMTDLQQENYKNANEGRVFKGAGYIEEVKVSKSQANFFDGNGSKKEMATVTVSNKASKEYKSLHYGRDDIIFIFEIPKDEAEVLQKGEYINFAGKISFSDDVAIIGRRFKLANAKLLEVPKSEGDKKDTFGTTLGGDNAIFMDKNKNELIYSPDLKKMINPKCPGEDMSGTIRNQIGFDCVGL